MNLADVTGSFSQPAGISPRVTAGPLRDSTILALRARASIRDMGAIPRKLAGKKTVVGRLRRVSRTIIAASTVPA